METITPEDFCIWLRGFVDAVGEYESVTVDQWDTLVKKYETVVIKPKEIPSLFNKGTPYDVFGAKPSYPGGIEYTINCGDKT